MITTALAISVWMEKVTAIDVSGIGIASSGVPSAMPGMKRFERDDQEDGTRGHRAAKSGNERRPSREKAGQRAVGLAQIDVLAAGLRPQRRELGVGHRAHEREDPSRQPRQQEPGGVGSAAATAGERKRMPPPMTLATMMAAASNGPSRRSRTGVEDGWSWSDTTGII